MSKSHEIIITVIDKLIEERRELRKKYHRKFKKLEFKPNFFCYRTAELLHYMLKDPLIKGNKEAERLIVECFGNCTRNTFHFIHLDDLKCLIINHDDNDDWKVVLK